MEILRSQVISSTLTLNRSCLQSHQICMNRPISIKNKSLIDLFVLLSLALLPLRLCLPLALLGHPLLLFLSKDPYEESVPTLVILFQPLQRMQVLLLCVQELLHHLIVHQMTLLPLPMSHLLCYCLLHRLFLALHQCQLFYHRQSQIPLLPFHVLLLLQLLKLEFRTIKILLKLRQMTSLFLFLTLFPALVPLARKLNQPPTLPSYERQNSPFFLSNQ